MASKSQSRLIAEAITDELNGGSYTQSFTAVRQYLPKYDLEELSSVRVAVVAKEEEAQPNTRAHTLDTHRIDVAVHKRIETSSDGIVIVDEIDTMLDFVEELKDTFRHGSQMANFTWIGTEHVPLYDPAKLEDKVFMSVFTLSYRSPR